jgi:3-deoxy-D-manno-octulosonic-acid transferase
LLLDAGALTVIEDAAALATAVDALWADPATAHATGAQGRMAVVANQGALARLLGLIGRRLAPAAT